MFIELGIDDSTLDNFSKSGEDYVTDAISKMCGRYDWHENILSNLIGSIKDMPLAESAFKGVIKKILKYVRETIRKRQADYSLGNLKRLN